MITKEKVIFIKTSEETGGEYTLVDCEGTPGVTTPQHYHKVMNQTFEVIKGVMNVRVNDEVHQLKQGDILTVPAGVPHTTYNASSKPARFMCTIKPGHTGYENFLKMTYILPDNTFDEEGKRRIYLEADTYMP